MNTSREPNSHIPTNTGDTEINTGAPVASTLIEFPRAGRAVTKPQWRKELSERVREIQQRRAQEAAREAAEAAAHALEQGNETRAEITVQNTSDALPAPAPQLGLVPPPDAPEPNPLVIAALKRIERARQQTPTPTMPRASRGGRAAATAVARVADERYGIDEESISTPQVVELPSALEVHDETSLQTSPIEQSIAPEQYVEVKTVTGEVEAATLENSVCPTEVARTTNLTVVPSLPSLKTEVLNEPPLQRPVRRVFAEVVDDALIARREAETAVATVNVAAPELDERAPLSKRIAGSIVDLLVVAFAASPFAAIIELTNGNWTDIRVAASMSGILIVLMFIYLAASTALAGRTWGMSLVGLRTVDAQTGLAPTTGQCARRAFAYMVSLALCGLGLLYAVFDAEGRAVHDHLSGTIIVRE